MCFEARNAHYELLVTALETGSYLWLFFLQLLFGSNMSIAVQDPIFPVILTLFYNMLVFHNDAAITGSLKFLPL